MNEKQMESWVVRNCKFAGIMDMLGQQVMNQMIANPPQAMKILLDAYRGRAGMGGAFSQISAADIQNDLAMLDGRLFPGQNAVLNRPENVQAIVSLVQPKAQAPQQQKPGYIPDPFEQFKNQRQQRQP